MHAIGLRDREREREAWPEKFQRPGTDRVGSQSSSAWSRDLLGQATDKTTLHHGYRWMIYRSRYPFLYGNHEQNYRTGIAGFGP